MNAASILLPLCLLSHYSLTATDGAFEPETQIASTPEATDGDKPPISIVITSELGEGDDEVRKMVAEQVELTLREEGFTAAEDPGASIALMVRISWITDAEDEQESMTFAVDFSAAKGAAAPMKHIGRFGCRCSGRELLGRIDVRLRKLIPKLIPDSAEGEPKSPPAVVVQPPRSPPPPSENRLSREAKLEISAVVILPLGLAAVLMGTVWSATAAGVHDRIDSRGLALLGAGAGLTIIGGTLLGISLKEQRRRRAALGPGFGLSLSQRF